MTGTCIDCGRALHSSMDPIYREVTGWARHRDRGINAITDYTYTGQVKCATCMDVAKGKQGEQLGLFL